MVRRLSGGDGATVSPRRRAGRLASGDAIREAAAVLFLEKGYAGTSMDEIAARAQVSKQTIYTHFPSKDALFADLVLANAERVEGFIASLDSAFRADESVESALRKLSRLYLAFVIRPEVLRLRRLVVAEAGRFPDLARAYYRQVPERVYRALATLFAEAAQAGRLQITDPGLAAQHFAWLGLGMPLDRGMFLPGADMPPAVELDRLADAASAVFLAAYGTRR